MEEEQEKQRQTPTVQSYLGDKKFVIETTGLLFKGGVLTMFLAGLCSLAGVTYNHYKSRKKE